MEPQDPFSDFSRPLIIVSTLTIIGDEYYGEVVCAAVRGTDLFLLLHQTTTPSLSQS
jgi:hypothetical protein